MSTHITRLRRQCQPVQEDTPVAPREHRISVDKRDLLQLLADYDALHTELETFLQYAWEFNTKFNPDGTIRRIRIDVRNTTQMNVEMSKLGAERIREFIASMKDVPL